MFLTEFGDHAVQHVIKFWIDNHATHNATTDAIRTNIWYELRRAGIKIPVSPSTVQLERAQPGTRQADPETVRAILRDLPLFQSLDEFERETLVAREDCETIEITKEAMRRSCGTIPDCPGA